MQELIEKIISQTGINHEQAAGAINAIKSYVSEKFPVIATHLEGILGGNADATAQTGDGEGILQKVTHFAEEHVGSLKGGAGSMLSEAEEKLKGLF